MHHSQMGQWDLLNADMEYGALEAQWDIVMLQEPYLDSLGNPKATSNWQVVKPFQASYDNAPPIRSIIMVNTRLKSDSWEIIDMPNTNNDLTGIQLRTEKGNFSIFNIYNDCSHSQTLELLKNFINGNKTKILPTEKDMILLGGDLNRHHPLWESEYDEHLMTNKSLSDAQQIIVFECTKVYSKY